MCLCVYMYVSLSPSPSLSLSLSPLSYPSLYSDIFRGWVACVYMSMCLPCFLVAHIEVVLNYGKMLLCPPPVKLRIFNPLSLTGPLSHTCI